ncbi:ankyrin repeat domain-containing protein, partial [Wolbachia endosymbiont of Pentidionis agamae]|uniref:ankyrin repeat domain-containing protein n=1 Tax=Wolbachia endosymbiont of Pentidionis agamae TaxID=3110435 RepID=UPI002FD2780B
RLYRSDIYDPFRLDHSIIKMINLLIKKGADIQVTDANGRSLLHYASLWGEKELVKMLLGNDPSNINLPDKVQLGTPLVLGIIGAGHNATLDNKNDYIETVKLLINNGAGVNVKDQFSQSILHLAAKGTDTEIIIKLLIDNGANCNAIDNAGKKPSYYAKDEEIRKMISECETKEETLKNLIKQKEAELHKVEENFKKANEEKTDALKKLIDLTKEMDKLSKKEPALEKVLSDVKDEFTKCNLGQKLESITGELQKISNDLIGPGLLLSPGKTSFKDVINKILTDSELLKDKDMKSSIIHTVNDMLEMLKKCGTEAEDKIYVIGDKVGEINEALKSGTTDMVDPWSF